MTEYELVEDLVFMMREEAFHCTDEEARKIVDRYIERFPVLLYHHSKDWYCKHV